MKASKNKMITPIKVLIDTDPLKDGDDGIALAGMAGLTKLGYLNPIGVFGNLYPAQMRARYVRWLLNEMGMKKVPVGVGEDCVASLHISQHELDAPLTPLSDITVSGLDLMKRLFEKQSDHSLTEIYICGLTFAAKFLQKYPALYQRKVKEVVLMSGVERGNGEVKLYNDYMKPDKANNNTFDFESAAYLYARLQELGIPLVIVTRDAAYATLVKVSRYDEIRATGPAGQSFYDIAENSIFSLWEAANASAGDPKRGTLPMDRDANWFRKVFLKGREPNLNPGFPFIHNIEGFAWYDMLAILASVPELKTQFFESVPVLVNGVQHNIIGLDSLNHGVKNPTQLVDAMVELVLKGLSK